MKRLLLTGITALLLATGAAHAQKYHGPTTADDPMYQADPDIDRAEGLRPPKITLTPEEICEHFNREDGSWWHCMINEYRNKPCDIACQLSAHDK